MYLTILKRLNSISFFKSFNALLTLSYLLESVLKYLNLLSLLLLARTYTILLFNAQLNSKLPITPTQSFTLTALLLTIGVQFSTTASGLIL
jgi:hypothetical protein